MKILKKIKNLVYSLLKRSEKYTGTDNIYLAKGGFWLVTLQVISLATGLALYIAFANLFSPKDYGIYKYAISIFALLGIFSLEGMNTSLIRSVAKGFGSSLTAALKEKMKYSVLGSIILVVISGYYFLRENPLYGIIFLIGAFFFSFYSNFNIYQSFLNGRKEFKKRTFYFTLSQVFFITGLIAALWLGAKLITVIFLYFFLQTVSTFFIYRKVSTQKLNKEKDPEMIGYGKHLSIIGAMGTIGSNIDKLIVYHFLGPVELAIYAFALLPVDHIRSSFKLIKPLALPKFSQRNLEELKKTIPKRSILLLGLIILTILIYLLIASPVYKFLFPQYVGSVFFSKIYALSLLATVAVVPGTILLSQKRTKALYATGIISSIAKIILLFILTFLYGILGAIVAIIITKLLIAGIYYYVLK